jgi:hypothetical protein
MLLVFSPEDGGKQEFVFNPFELLSIEAELVEELGPWDSYDEFLLRLRKGNVRAKRALLWIMLKRQNPRLRFPELVVKVNELDLQPDQDEIRAALDSGNLTDEERADALILLAEGGDQAVVEPAEGKGEPVAVGTDST